ncbi:MAG: CHRD domain-containing protein [bacterium]
MRKLAPALCALALLAATSPVPAGAAAHMHADLDGNQEVPPTGSPGTGIGQFVIDTDTNTLFYYIEYSGLAGTETAAHIHGFAAPGVNAGVRHALPAGNPKIGSWAYAEADENSILGGLTYVNIHTTVNAGGEIRGQVLVDPDTDFVAVLQGSQEVPPNASTGLGIGSFRIDTAANTLQYDIRFAGLVGTESACHFHGPAAPGVNAGVLQGIATGNPKVGTWNYLEAQEASITGGLVYFNVHSTVLPGGEIRGQLFGQTLATGVNDLPAADRATSLFAAPNPVPATANATLFFRLREEGEARVTIHDVSGRVVRTVHEGRLRDSGLLSWDLRADDGSRVSAGVYFARLESATGSESSRIVVLK